MLAAGDKRIILARHGESTGNRDGLVLGRADFPLTSKGKVTAERLGFLIRREPVAAVFSSPLSRAVTSAELYTSGTGLTINARVALAELSCGQWETMPRSQFLRGKRQIRDTWFDAPPGGESYRDAEDRVESVIRELLSEVGGECMLVVAHAGINRVFLKKLLGLRREIALQITCPHDTIYLIHRGQIRSRSASGHETEGLILDHGERVIS